MRETSNEILIRYLHVIVKDRLLIDRFQLNLTIFSKPESAIRFVETFKNGELLISLKKCYARRSN